MRPRELRSPELCFVAVLTLGVFLGLAGCSTPESRAIDVLRAKNAGNEAQLAAIRQLQASGKQAVLQAQPELIQVLGSSAADLQRAAEEALVLGGPEVAGDLIKSSADLQRRPSVLRILRHETVDDMLIQQVAAGTRSGDYTDRLHATELLGALSVKNTSALDQLQRLISDQDPLVRITAINETTDLDLSGRSALVPVLIRALDDPTIAVREAACIGLGNIGPAAIEAKSALERLTKERGTRLAKLAQIALANITEAKSEPSRGSVALESQITCLRLFFGYSSRFWAHKTGNRFIINGDRVGAEAAA